MMNKPEISESRASCPAPRTNLSLFEQHASLGAGAVLLALAVVQRTSLRSFLIAAFGVGFLFRGVTGHCHLYEALGVCTSEPASSDTENPNDHELQTMDLTHAGNRIDKDRFEKLRSAQVDRGRDEREAVEIAAEEVKELRRREGRSKDEFQAVDLE